VLFRRPIPPSAAGPVSSVEVAAGPGARRGAWGSAPGPTWADRFRRISISHAATKQRCGSVVGRILDTLDEDANGVSALQHSARSVSRCGNNGAKREVNR